MLRAPLALLALLVACGDNNPPTVAEVATFPAASRPDLDVLFLIDNTTAGSYQVALGQAMPTLLGALAVRPGGLPNLHIGVATSDLGTTGSLDRTQPAASVGAGEQGGCVGSGQAGALVIPASAGVAGAFVSDVAVAGGRQTNYTGDLASTLLMMITGVGVAGCGFEQTLAAVGVALANPANAGFRRPDAGLAVIVLSDEDDCSVRDAGFFDPDGTGPLGPLESFRCTAQGVTCAEPITTVGPKTACAPAVGNAYIEDLSDLVAGVTAAEPAPLRRAVAAIVAPPTPFAIELRSPGNGSPGIPALAHGCANEDPSGRLAEADPAVRTAAWVTALGGASYPVCENDDTAVARGIAAQLLAIVDGDPCIQGALPVDRPLACDVAEDTTPIPGCPAAAPCYELVTDTAACAATPTHLRVQIDRAAPASPDATIHVTCEL